MIIIIIIILKLKTMLTRTVRETHLVSGVRQWRQGWFSGVARIWYEGHKTSWKLDVAYKVTQNKTMNK